MISLGFFFIFVFFKRVFYRYIDSRLFIQERRYAEFVSTKRKIIACMEDLEQMPDTSFERDVVCEEEEAFCLSIENITALNVLLSQVNAHTISTLLKPLTTTLVFVAEHVSHTLLHTSFISTPE